VAILLLTSRVVEYLNTLILARGLPAAHFGLINLGFTIHIILSTFCLLGMHLGSTRFISIFIAENNPSKARTIIIAGGSTLLLVGISVGGLIAIFSKEIATYVFNKSDFSAVLRVFAITIPVTILSSFFGQCLKGLSRINQAVFLEVLNKVFRLSLFSGIFLLSFSSVVQISFVYFLSYLAHCLIAFFLITKSINPFGPLSKNVYPNFILFSIPLVFTSLFLTIEVRFGTSILGLFRSSQEVGIYSAALSISYLPLLVGQFFQPVLLPLFAKLFAKDNRKELVLVYRTVARWIFYGNLMILLPLCFCAETFIIILFGINYAAAQSFLPVLTIAFFFYSFANPAEQIVVAIGKSKTLFYFDLVALMMNISIATAFVSSLGISAVILANLVSYMALSFSRFYIVFRYSQTVPIEMDFLKPVLCLLLNGAVFHMTLEHFGTQLVINFFLLVLYITLNVIILFKTVRLKDEDLEILDLIETKLPFKITRLRKILTN